jgi:hypothetical protein
MGNFRGGEPKSRNWESASPGRDGDGFHFAVVGSDLEFVISQSPCSPWTIATRCVESFNSRIFLGGHSLTSLVLPRRTRCMYLFCMHRGRRTRWPDDCAAYRSSVGSRMPWPCPFSAGQGLEFRDTMIRIPNRESGIHIHFSPTWSFHMLVRCQPCLGRDGYNNVAGIAFGGRSVAGTRNPIRA